LTQAAILLYSANVAAESVIVIENIRIASPAKDTAKLGDTDYERSWSRGASKMSPIGAFGHCAYDLTQIRMGYRALRVFNSPDELPSLQ
jgi:hypothetical protein